jgi:hypothetical protein
MALYPAATKELIKPGVNDPKITAIGIILHTDAGNVGDLHDYFDGPSGGIESHFHIPKSRPVLQYRDTAYEADANYHGNSFKVGDDPTLYGFISVETQGLATDPWNDYQLAEIKKLILWAKSVHPRILLRVCPAWNEPGIGYHTLFGAPGPWTPVAKSCPGPKRIQQFNQIIVPWLKTAGLPAKPADTTEDTLSAKDVEDGIAAYMKRFFTDEQGTGDSIWDETVAHNQRVEEKLDRLVTAVEGLAAVLGRANP